MAVELLALLVAADTDRLRIHRIPGAHVHGEPARAAELDVHHVHVRLEQALERPLPGVYPHGDTAEDAGDLDAVTRLADIDELVVHTEAQGVRRLPVRHHVRRLLKADHLPVRVLAPVVDQREGAELVAHVAGAALRLVDPATVNVPRHGMVAHEAPEEGHLHVRDDGRDADHQPAHGDELVDVARVQLTHVGRCAAVRAHLVEQSLDQLDLGLRNVGVVAVAVGAHVLIRELEHLVLEYLVHDRHHLLGVPLQLHGQLLGRRESGQVRDAQVQVRLVRVAHLPQVVLVEQLVAVCVRGPGCSDPERPRIRPSVLEAEAAQERTEQLHGLCDRHVGAPDHLGARVGRAGGALLCVARTGGGLREGERIARLRAARRAGVGRGGARAAAQRHVHLAAGYTRRARARGRVDVAAAVLWRGPGRRREKEWFVVARGARRAARRPWAARKRRAERVARRRGREPQRRRGAGIWRSVPGACMRRRRTGRGLGGHPTPAAQALARAA